MRIQNKALWLVLLALVLVAGVGSFIAQAAKEGEVAWVDMQAIYNTYIQPVVDESLRPELAKLQTEFDSKAKGLSDEERTKLFQQYQSRLDSQRQSLINAQMKKLTDLIKQISTENGYSVVLDKEVIIAGGTEITAQVVTKWKAIK